MFCLTIRLQADSDKCLYEQIYDYIRQEIREGKLLAGEKLPSTRFLAEYLQVSRSTVDVAYDQLLSEGYIESKPYKGYYVCRMEELFRLGAEDRFPPGQETGFRQETEAAGNTENRSGRTQAISNGNRELFDNVKKDGREYLVDFSPNGIDMGYFPFGVWKKINRNILSDSSSELFAQGDAQGDYDLRATISRYLHSSRGVNCSPEQIIIGAGNDYLLMLLEKILGRHVSIAMENPTYKRAYQIFQSFAYDTVTVNMDEYGMKVTQLEQEKVTAAYVMPSHQFPTGTVMPIGRRTELLKWADGDSARFLIEDDYDSEFRYKGKPIPSLQASDEHGKVIYMGTFSKAIAPAIRVSYMVLPAKLLEIYERDCYFYSSTVSRIDQRILNEFIRDGYFERHLNKMRKIYRDKHDLMLELLGCFEKRFRISGENAGLHLLLTDQWSSPEKEMIHKAAQLGVKVYGLSGSFIQTGKDEGNKWPPTVLLGYGGLQPDQIREGTDLLKKAWL